ncbi:MAG: hypothetical protein ATN33_06140 [Epulopiscium sp. Nele67-Bin001]|nr:MAG: hypothetical protein BEN18_06690 [Epulopiscium sp. Nuni2H_MBin001]OON93096.1 MAG: hypothetical protein ATN33_06140 [Epulopiscium sp. Nele67-Bin001]
MKNIKKYIAVVLVITVFSLVAAYFYPLSFSQYTEKSNRAAVVALEYDTNSGTEYYIVTAEESVLYSGSAEFELLIGFLANYKYYRTIQSSVNEQGFGKYLFDIYLMDSKHYLIAHIMIGENGYLQINDKYYRMTTDDHNILVSAFISAYKPE